MFEDKKNSIISGIVTLLVMGLIVLLCAFMGLNPPDPPIPEEGVEVNLGNSDMGLGDVEDPNTTENMRDVPPPTPSQGENIATQKTSSVALNTSRDKTKANDQKVQEQPKTTPEKTEEPKVNSKALFPGKTGQKGGSQGVSQGTGNQGKEGGDPNSNRYDGQPGNGGSGYSLTGRSARALPTPTYTSQKEGKIIVKIWVDREGVVTKCEAPEQGSTITETGLVAQAKAAAMKAKFSADPNATELQVGRITYVFRRNN